MIKKHLLLLGLTTSLLAEMPEPKLSGYVDAFYTYDFNNPSSSKRQDFFFSHNRHNEFNINLALLKVALQEQKYRANVALQAGTYAQDNYPENYKYINEANVGISLNSKNNLWLDLGIFASHLGFDNAISMDNYNLTRSLAAESSPYYLTGAKLTYTPSEEWEFAAIICNGWQVIEKQDGNSLLSFGTQVIYKPNTQTKLNWSTFVGSDDPDTQRRMRYFNNLFGEFILSDSWRFIAGVDLGAQQKVKGSSSYDMWYIPSLLAKYTVSEEYALGMRVEYVNDTNGVVINGNDFGANTLGLTTNFDYLLEENIALRAEARWLQDTNDAYNENKDQTLFLTASLSIKF